MGHKKKRGDIIDAIATIKKMGIIFHTFWYLIVEGVGGQYKIVIVIFNVGKLSKA